MDNDKIKQSIKDLFSIMNNLREAYKDTNKKFTLDGRLVGDIGEVICANHYDIELFKTVKPKHDGEQRGSKKLVQIKSTFHDYLGFPCDQNEIPDYYLGIKLYEDGTFEEIYNGKGQFIYDELLKNRKKTKNSIFTVSIKQLKELNKQVKLADRIGQSISGKQEI